MISRLEGILEGVEGGVAEVRSGELWYFVLVPGCDAQRLGAQRGTRVVFHTLHYLEGAGQGATFTPRLIGFSSPRDRAFFELFTTVKGVGMRKALRALQLPFARVAAAIAEHDTKLLQSLPEIGKRSAETIIAELDGKVDRFLDTGVRGPDRAGASVEPKSAGRAIEDEALLVLVSLGEPRLEMIELIDRARRQEASIKTPEDLIAAVYRLKNAPA